MRFKEYLSESESDTNYFLRSNGISESDCAIVDGIVNVNDSVYISSETIHNGKLPIQFGIINGDFDITDCRLTTLKGCPTTVKGVFRCDYNKNITSLVGGPKTVIGSYICSGTSITSLEGIAEILPDVDNNKVKLNISRCWSLKRADQLLDMPHGITDLSTESGLESLVGIADVFANSPNLTWRIDTQFAVEGGIGLMLLPKGCTLSAAMPHHGNCAPFLIIKKYMGKPDDIFECQAELIAAGYEEYAQL